MPFLRIKRVNDWQRVALSMDEIHTRIGIDRGVEKLKSQLEVQHCE